MDAIMDTTVDRIAHDFYHYSPGENPEGYDPAIAAEIWRRYDAAPHAGHRDCLVDAAQRLVIERAAKAARVPHPMDHPYTVGDIVEMDAAQAAYVADLERADRLAAAEILPSA